YRAGAHLAVADELEYRLRARVSLLALPEPLRARHVATVAPERCRRCEPVVAGARRERPHLFDLRAPALACEPFRHAEREVETRDQRGREVADVSGCFSARRQGTAL